MNTLTGHSLRFGALCLTLVACLVTLAVGELGVTARFVVAGGGIAALLVWYLSLAGRTKALAATQRRFDRLVEQAPLGLVFLEERPDGVLAVVEANATAGMLLGSGVPLTRGRPVEEALPGLLGTEVPRRLAEIARDGGTAVFEGLPYEYHGVSGVYDLRVLPLGTGNLVLSVSDAASRLLLAESLRRREAELTTIVGAASDAILIFGERGGPLLYANHAACGMTGYTLDELRAMRLADLLAADERLRLEQFAAPSGESDGDGEKGGDAAEWRMTRKDGSTHPVEMSVQPLADGRHVAVARDIGERRRDEERLRLAEQVFANAHEAIIITNASGAIVEVNDAFCVLSGYPRDELIGRNPRILSSGRQDGAFYRALWLSLREKGHWTGEIWNRRRNGELYVQLNSIAAVKNAAGEITHYVGMSFDITQRKEDELALRRHRDHLQELVAGQVVDLVRAKEEAERANRAKSEFLANMSHELRTPLHAILGFSELGGPIVASNPVKAVDYFAAIHKSGQRLLGLLNALLDLSRLEAGKVELECAPVELAALVREVFDELAPQAAQRRIRCRLGVLVDETSIEGDRRQLGQVVRNLVANALRFSPDGGVIDVALEAARESPDAGDAGDLLRLSVADRGPGVPAAELETIFDTFVQSSRTRDGAGGTGLGLPISREIVALHGGRIVAGNRLDGGARFDVLLPRKAPWPQDADADDAVPPAPTFADRP